MPRPDADAMAAMGCRTSMMTVGGTVDCWIAQLAIEHSAALLHRDRDFEHISRVALSSRR
jgi:predicted nucleic acid-binding protein